MRNVRVRNRVGVSLLDCVGGCCLVRRCACIRGGVYLGVVDCGVSISGCNVMPSWWI